MRRTLGLLSARAIPRDSLETAAAIVNQNRSAQQECGDRPALESVHRLVHLKVSRENHDLFDLDAVISAD